jgi:hypothetical protein
MVFFAILVALIVGFVILLNKSREFAGIASGIFYFLAGAAIVIGLIAVLPKEGSLDSRDAVIKSKLDTMSIRFVELQGFDERIVVEKDGCTARYNIESSADLQTQPTVWPLVAGTGHIVSGCADVDLNKRFIRQ